MYSAQSATHTNVLVRNSVLLKSFGKGQVGYPRPLHMSTSMKVDSEATTFAKELRT